MKIGDLVKIMREDGSIFGRGIFLSDDLEINNLMSPHLYSDIWVFHYENYNLKPNTLKIRSYLLSKIDKPEDW